jgi:hypothetical protein
LFWLNAKARLGSRACLDFFVSSILPNWVKLVGQLFLTFIWLVLNELSCFPEAGGLDSFLLGFWGVEWDKLLICYEVMPIEFGKQGRDKSGMGLGGGRRRRFVNQQRVTSNE